MNIQQLFTSVNSELNDIVQQLQPEQLAVQVPDYAFYRAKGTIRDMLQVGAHENACVAPMLAGEKGLKVNAEITEDYLKDDFKANFARLTNEANEAVLKQSEEDLNRIVHMSYMDSPAREYLSDIVIQRSSAAIDIAQAAGISFAWPEDLVQGIWDIANPNADVLRQYEVFPPEVAVDASAPLQDRLIGLMGRKP